MGRKIIINGRKLNSIQGFFFDRSSKLVYFVSTFPFLAMVLMASLFIIAPETKQANELKPVFLITIISALVLMTIMVDKVLFIQLKDSKYITISDIENALKKSYFVNAQTIERLYAKISYNKEARMINMLKNSYGHKIIENWKLGVYNQCPEMINYMQKPSKKLIEDFILHNTLREEKCFTKPFTFKSRNLGELRYFYSMINNIRQSDTFAQKAIAMKSKDELYKQLDRALVKN